MRIGGHHPTAKDQQDSAIMRLSLGTSTAMEQPGFHDLPSAFFTSGPCAQALPDA
jgi:hypothetical protein